MTQRSTNDGGAHRFRIVSANLWNGGADPGAFAELMVSLEADAVATQEMTPEQARALARVFPYGHLEPAYDYSGMGIALRHPAAVRRIPLPCRDARVAELRVAGAAGAAVDFELINLHVLAPHSLPLWGTAVQRRGQLRGVVRHLEASPHRRRVLVGDFNASPAWPLYRRFAARLTDAAVAAARRHGRPVERTWGPWPRGPRLLRIDHAFVHGVAVEDFQVIPIEGGDHCAIVVDVAIAAGAIAGAMKR